MVLAIKRISKAPHRPPWPTTTGKRRNMITPSIVKTLGVTTPAKVPNLACRLPEEAFLGRFFLSMDTIKEITRFFCLKSELGVLRVILYHIWFSKPIIITATGRLVPDSHNIFFIFRRIPAFVLSPGRGLVAALSTERVLKIYLV